ncbi:MAG: hypothetical protein P8P30_03325 [Rickettsiales bacterium]|nr:hypothetical protein [Rickettsiales bacterium]
MGSAAYAVAGGERKTAEKKQQAESQGKEFKPKKRWFARIVAAVAAVLTIDAVVRGDQSILGKHTAKYIGSLGNGIGGFGRNV